MTPEILRRIDTRKHNKEALNQSRSRVGKASGQAEFNEACKRLRRDVKNDKQMFIDSLAEEAEQPVGSKKKWKLAGKPPKPEWPINNKQGKNIMNKEEQLNIWA